ncbi:hypothetical protein ACIF8T_02880 [Streptomyces sp. NPDC085946]|uniref:hypothetical protein n=1 Tax=Streptomyces sp. NPDC085946 TaxID=3365744 RepID=UPI0037CDBFE8
MSDTTRQPGDGAFAERATPLPEDRAPDARGESALGTGHGASSGTGRGEPSPAGAQDLRGTADTRGAGGTGAADAGRTAFGGHEATGTHGDRTPGGSASGDGARLLPHEESDTLAARLQHAVAEFVDKPQAAVEEADHVLEELASRFTDAVTQRRRTLRRSWQSADAGGGRPTTNADTEQLRLALRDYRELAERLLHV